MHVDRYRDLCSDKTLSIQRHPSFGCRLPRQSPKLQNVAENLSRTICGLRALQDNSCGVRAFILKLVSSEHTSDKIGELRVL